MKKQSHKVALVLGTGGARGLAHIGVIKALEENQIPIDIITGTSIGALIGGLYASGKDVKSLEKIVHGVDKFKVAKIFMPKIFSSGFTDNKRVIDFLEQLVGDIKIENMRIPFAAVSTDLITGEEVILNKGSLVNAIMASIAIPAIFQPEFINGRYLIDGGVSNPLPISVAVEMKAKKIIAVNVSPNPERILSKSKKRKTREVKALITKIPAMFSSFINNDKYLVLTGGKERKEKENMDIPLYSPSMVRLFLQSVSISINNLMVQHLRHSTPDILIKPKIDNFDLLEFYKGSEIIKCGFDATILLLQEIKECLEKE